VFFYPTSSTSKGSGKLSLATKFIMNFPGQEWGYYCQHGFTITKEIQSFDNAGKNS